MITVHLTGECWKTKAVQENLFFDAKMRDWKVKAAFKRFLDLGFTNINCVMEDHQYPINSDTRFTHAYTYNENGDIERFKYDDSFREADENSYI